MDEQWEGLPGLREMAEKIRDPNVEIPAYYYAPIHAYKDGTYAKYTCDMKQTITFLYLPVDFHHYASLPKRILRISCYVVNTNCLISN